MRKQTVNNIYLSLLKFIRVNKLYPQKCLIILKEKLV